MGKKLCVLTVLSLFFFLTCMTVEVQEKAWSCPVVEQSVDQDFHKEAEYWTVSTPYLFFTFDYIAPFSLVVASDADMMCLMYALAAEKSVCCPDVGMCLVPELSRPLVPPGSYMGRDYYVFALRHIVV